jgi:amino acid adenylation domain-containing protein
MHRYTLANQFLEYSASRLPDKVALIHGDMRLTYSEIDAMANRLARFLLSSGVERGDRVAIFMDNSIEAVISIFGVMKAGAAFMMINHTTKADKFGYILDNSRATAVLAHSSKMNTLTGLKCPAVKTIITSGACDKGQNISFDEIIRSGNDAPVPARCIDVDLASIIYTSGSTGQPKGVMLSHLNMVSAAHSITTYLENTEKDIIINVLPLSFDYGLYQVLMAFSVGGTVILEKSFTYPYQVIELMSMEKVTGLPGVPTIFALLLHLKDIDKFDFSSLRYITNTAAALPVSHIHRLRELFPHARLYSMYGLTECKRVSYLPPEELDTRPNSIGRGMPNEEVYIVNERGDKVAPGEIGELVVRGSNVMMGYWEMPEETARCLRPGKYPGERVLYSGDLFKMDDKGYLYFLARKDDIIKCKGEKVSPKEIENVLYSLRGVLEAAVVGVPDEILGQAIKAFIALETGSKLTEKEILSYCSQHLENHMLPKYIVIMDGLPKTTSGKINKKSLVPAGPVQ